MTEWSERAMQWAPPESWRRIVALDAHTAGEPLRVIVGGLPDFSGDSVLEKRKDARENHDDLRRALMWEPRGHADMYGCYVLPPVTPRADIAVLFTHNEGYSTMCGHGIVAVTTALLEAGILEAREPRTLVRIDTPAGFIEAWATVRHGRVEEVSFVNVRSFVAGLDRQVDLPGVGSVRYDLAFGGAFYAYVDASDFGFKLVPEESRRIIDWGRRVKEAVQASAPPVHPVDDELGFLYGTIFVGEAHHPGAHSRNVCVFADGELDRSPTGTGVSGRLAIHHARGEVEVGQEIGIESILGTTFDCRILEVSEVGGVDGITPEVTGSASLIGRNELLIAPDDPLADGFLIR